MDYRIASARPWGRALVAAMAAFSLAAAAFAPALAQTNAPPKKPAPPKAAPKPAAPPAAQQPPAQAPQGQPSVQEVRDLLYTPWTKACEKSAQTNNKQVCFIHTDGRLQTGQPVVVAEIIEPEGQEKVLQIIIAATILVQNGTRIMVDQQELGQAPYLSCSFQGGCLALYKADDATIAKLKSGKDMEVQTIIAPPPGKVLSFPLSLANFAKAYDGPPIDPKALEAQQRQLQSELQKKADEARKKLEAQQPGQTAPPPKQ